MLARLDAGLERERRFVADASHELRTPLSLLKTELELALRRPRSRRGAARGDRVGGRGDRPARAARRRPAVARAVGRGRAALRLRGRSPSAELLETVASRFAARAAAAGRSLEVDAPPGLAIVGDRLRLEQALGNLVDNALRYGAGTVRLDARLAETARLELRVTTREPASRRPSSRGPSSASAGPTSRAARGVAGLGLALVDAIVRAHGGSASAANRARGGAQVTLALPGLTQRP